MQSTQSFASQQLTKEQRKPPTEPDNKIKEYVDVDRVLLEQTVQMIENMELRWNSFSDSKQLDMQKLLKQIDAGIQRLVLNAVLSEWEDV